MSLIKEQKVNRVGYDEDDFDDEDENYEDADDEVVESVKILSLFDKDKWFDDIRSLYKYELEANNFNLVKVVRKFQMDMLSYIKMINFIRKTVKNHFFSCIKDSKVETSFKKPSASLFNEICTGSTQVPWNSDEYFQTIVEDDPLLQFGWF